LPTRAGFSRGTAPSRRDVLRLGAAGAAAAVLAPLGGCASNNQKPAGGGKGQRTVIVIGGGFAGLACADTLAHGGVNVILLEATGRPGGRVRTDRKFIPGDNVELGGEWIGANHPTWLEYAQEFNLRLEEPNAPPEPSGVLPPTTEPASPGPAGAGPGAAPAPGANVARPVPFETEMDTSAPEGRQDQGPDGPRRVPREQAVQQLRQRPTTGPATTHAGHEGDEPIILNGKLIRGEQADKLYEEIDGVVAKLIELARGVDPVRPWTSPNAAELDARSFAQFVGEQQGLSEQARALLLTGAESDNGVPADRMSLLAYCAMVAGGGFNDYYELSETYRLADGNDALATALSQKLGNRIIYNSYVDAVRRTPYGVIVRTRGGEYYRGDAVVIAVPPSVWGQFAVEPPLPDALRPQMGENVKLIVALREPVWEQQGLTSELTSDGVVGLTWAATEARNGRGPVALTMFSGANQAETLRRYAPPERRVFAFAAVEPAYPNLLDAFISERFIDWPGFPLSRASYSFPAPGEVTAFGPVLVDGIMADGLPPLLFAGEHTSYGFIGYMEGALSSGVRAARMLLGTVQRVPNNAPPVAQPATNGPVETQPAPEPVKEGAPA
jgi:monoamine oxidase